MVLEHVENGGGAIPLDIIQSDNMVAHHMEHGTLAHGYGQETTYNQDNDYGQENTYGRQEGYVPDTGYTRSSSDSEPVSPTSGTDHREYELDRKPEPPSSPSMSSTTMSDGDSESAAATGPDLRCGFGSCKPAWLQACNNPKAFLAILCWFSFLQGRHKHFLPST